MRLSGGLNRAIIPGGSFNDCKPPLPSRKQRRRGNHHLGNTVKLNVVNKKLRICSLNINGTKSSIAKLASLENDVLIERNVDVVLLCETKLMNEECLPAIDGYSSVSSNRSGTTGRFSNGGVAIIYRNTFENIFVHKGNDFVAQAVRLEESKWVFISFYMKHGSVRENTSLLRKMTMFIRKECSATDCIVLGGDANAHLAELGGKQNPRGRLLESFCLENGFTNLNLTDMCIGRKTRGNSCIDYILVNDAALKQVETLAVDEDQHYVFSDHNLLELVCTRSKHRTQQTVRYATVTNVKAASGIVEDVLGSESIPKTYCMLKESAQRATRAATHRVKRPRKALVHSNLIRELTMERKRCCRVWRQVRGAKQTNDEASGTIGTTRCHFLRRVDGSGSPPPEDAISNTGAVESEQRRAGKTHTHNREVCDPDVRVAEERYRAAQQSVREEVRRELRRRDQLICAKILRAPKGTRAKLMWKYIKSLNRPTQNPARITNPAGVAVTHEERRDHLTKTAQSLLIVSTERDDRVSLLDAMRAGENTGISVLVDEITEKLGNINERTGCGLDNIPANLLKSLGENGISYITELFNRIFAGTERIPSDWKEGKVKLLKKPNSKEGLLSTYRPITITPVLYRLFTRILAERIQDWMEECRVLGEMQNGFRRGRRGDDNVFILTSAIELSRKNKTGLVACFLDCSKAFDRIDRLKLWRTLSNYGMNPAWIDLLQRLYMESKIMLIHDDSESDWLYTTEGVKQGCPLSSILFSIYIADLEARLMKSGLGFRIAKKVEIWNVREKKHINVPGLLFADDLCLLAESRTDIQKLLEITSDFGNEMDLHFNPKKSATIVFSRYHIGDCRELLVQGEVIPLEHEYKYLGITLCDGSNYLVKQEQIWISESKRALHQMQATLLWSSNRFELGKTFWKAVAVPKLTYTNAVTTVTAKTCDELEKNQRRAARWALGIQGWKVANEFLEGELNWTSFEAREAKSKLKYRARIESMPASRWPRAIMDMIILQKLKTKTSGRMEELNSKFDCKTLRVEHDERGGALLGLFYRQLDERIKSSLDITWAKGMADKSMLKMYMQHKESRTSAVHLYDNGRGSALLALARAGSLPTRVYKSHFSTNPETTCGRCGVYAETLKHVIFECNDPYHTTEDLCTRIGLSEELNLPAVDATKRLLERWERENNGFAELARA